MSKIRQLAIDMIKEYQKQPVEFFTGDDVLDVELIYSWSDKTLQSCIITLTS